MRLPRMTTRRWMIAVAVVALLSWIAILFCPLFQPDAPNVFDAVEMIGPDPPLPK